MNTEIKPGYGYRMLKEGERIAVGDEYFDAQWRMSDCPHQVVKYNSTGFCKHFPHRRAIDPGEGWEIVPENESPTDTDCEYTEDGEKWYGFGTVLKYKTCRAAIDEGWTRQHFLAFRRRKSPKPLPVGEWIDLPTVPGDGSPRDRFMTQDEAGFQQSFDRYYIRNRHQERKLVRWFNHPQPPPVKSGAEKAWEKVENDPYTDKRSPIACFIAGFNAGKESK